MHLLLQVLQHTSAELDGVWWRHRGGGASRAGGQTRTWYGHTLPAASKQALPTWTCCRWVFWDGGPHRLPLASHVQDPAQPAQQGPHAPLRQETLSWRELLESHTNAHLHNSPFATCIMLMYISGRWKLVGSALKNSFITGPNGNLCLVHKNQQLLDSLIVAYYIEYTCQCHL